jgi:lipoic acid synthetase
MIDGLHRAPPSRLPPWLKRPLVFGATTRALEQSFTDANLHTVCEEARCPNRGDCFNRGTAAFLILGNVCTRQCRFCGVSHGAPLPVDADEPRRVVDAVRLMGISHAVVTSVTRDDVNDGGAGMFARVIGLLKHEVPSVTVEVLVPDFAGNAAALRTVLHAGPHVFNHNMETVPRLYPFIRPGAGYRRSLELLAHAARFEAELDVKSGLMVGLGETCDEMLSTLSDMREAGVTMVTIGQYLRPSREQAPVAEFITPAQFDFYRDRALAIGFAAVSCGPFVRSSYRAGHMLKEKNTPQGHARTSVIQEI